MQFPLSDSQLFAAEISPEDDIDRLFQRLHKLEPPANILQQIISRIKQLPAAQRRVSPRPEDEACPPSENQREVSDQGL